MKKYILVIVWICILFICAWEISYAQAVNIPGSNQIQDVSLNVGTSGNVVNDIYNVWFRILTIVKRFIMGLLVIFSVYIGVMMMISLGTDEEKLSAAKRQIWYMLVALVFINIPGTLYEAFNNENTTTVWNTIWSNWFENASSESAWNLFFDFLVFSYTLNNQIVMFLEVMIFLWAVFMTVIAGIQLMTSRGREEKLKEARQKILYIILALIFVSIIEAWKRLAFWWVISDGVNLFASLANLALFFAAPVAIFFLTLAGYYYITSNGDEEQTKKAKSIIINTVLATLILLASYTFLLDLSTL